VRTDKKEIRNKINATYTDSILREHFEVLVYLTVPLKKSTVIVKNTSILADTIGHRNTSGGGTGLCKMQCIKWILVPK
jgi:hypothetical protein